jgi:hypothetical protein
MTSVHADPFGIDPDSVRQARASGEHAVDVWASSACGLVDERCLSRLAVLRMGTGDVPDEDVTDPKDSGSCQESLGNVTTYLTQAPSYVPYESAGVTRHRAGEVMCHQVIETVFHPDVSSSVRASPLTATALITAASVRANLWSGHTSETGQGLAVVATLAPKKGGEAYQLIREYSQHHAEGTDSAAPMILRDFYSSIYAWQFIRCIDERILDLCGAALCLTTAIDYVGASDDPAGGGYDVYTAAASEGVTCLAGKAATQALQDMVVADAFMVTKDAMAEKAKEINDADVFIGVNGGPVTPNEFLRARWWDAAMVPYHRLVMSTTHYKNLTDSLGTFKSADRCGRIKRAVDSIIRYDEIVDAISDYINKECFNELLVALATGGSKSARNYAQAVAKVTDDALECDCGENGHEEAAELAMGACLWYQLAPRYMARRQLFSYAAGTDVVREAYAWPAPGERLSAAADVCLRPGNTLHATTWEPLWKESRDTHQPALARLAHRIANRSLTGNAGQEARYSCEAAARSVLADCDTLDGQENLRALSEKWCHLFETVLAGVSAGEDIPHGLSRQLCSLVDRIWRHTVVGSRPADAAEGIDEQLFIDVDRAVRRTYLLAPAQGIAIRRAFFGVTTSAVELSGLGPYARLNNGAAHMHSLAETPLS